MGQNTLKFIEISSIFLTSYKINSSKTPFPKRLLFISRLEKQTSRLLTLLLIQKLKKVVELKYFCGSVLSIPYFKCTNKITTLEYIKTINS